MFERIAWLLLALLALAAAPAASTKFPGPPGTGEVVCYSPGCYAAYPTGHCDTCCAGDPNVRPCDDFQYSCSACDCRYPNLCHFGTSHCEPSPGQNVTSQPWPIETPGRCCPDNRAGSSCELCSVGYYGKNCSKCVVGPKGAVCSGHGTCSGSGTHAGTGKCTCDAGWGVEADCSQCELKLWQCPGQVNSTGGICSGHGTCSCTGNRHNQTKCTCERVFTGDDCSMCAVGYESRNGTANCSYCIPGFFGNGPKPGVPPVCNPCPECGPHSVCNGSGTNAGSYVCLCTDGYSGLGCLSAPTNWFVVGPILGCLGLLVGSCVAWRFVVYRRQKRESAQAAVAAALLADQKKAEAAAAKAAKKAKKRRKAAKKAKKGKKKRRRRKQQQLPLAESFSGRKEGEEVDDGAGVGAGVGAGAAAGELATSPGAGADAADSDLEAGAGSPVADDTDSDADGDSPMLAGTYVPPTVPAEPLAAVLPEGELPDVV